MKTKHLFTPLDKSAQLLEPEDRRVYHLPAFLAALTISALVFFILLKIGFRTFDLGYIKFVYKEIENGALKIFLDNYSLMMFGRVDLPILKTMNERLYTCIIASLIVFIAIYKLTLKPVTDVKILSDGGYIYNRYDDAINNYQIETKKYSLEGDKFHLAKEGYYTSNLKRIEDPVMFSNREDEKGKIIIGLAGQGKTVLLNQMIQDIFNQKDGSICILHNIKGDELKFIRSFSDYYNIATSRYGNEKIHAVNLLPLIKSDNEIIQEANVSTFVVAFAGRPEGANIEFKQGAIQILKAVVLEALSRLPNPDTFIDEIIYAWNGTGVGGKEELSSIDVVYLKEYLEKWNKVARSYIDVQNIKGSKIMISCCIEAIKKLEFINNAWKKLDAKYIDLTKDFALNEKTRRFLLLSNDPTTPELCDAYISGITNLLVNYLISAKYTNTFNRNIYFLLDEFPQLSALDIKTIMKLPDVGRSKGLRVILAMQKFSQIKTNFNYDISDFSSSFPIKIICQLGESDIDNTMKILGKTAVKRWIWQDGKKIAKEELKEPLQFNDLKTAGPVIINGHFYGVKLFYVIPGHREIFSLIVPPVDISKEEGEFRKLLKIQKEKRLKKKPLSNELLTNIAVPTSLPVEEEPEEPIQAVLDASECLQEEVQEEVKEHMATELIKESSVDDLDRLNKIFDKDIKEDLL